MRFIKAIFLTAVLVLSLSAREQVNVNFANLQIDDFIKLVSKITNKNILINHKVNGTVDFVSTAPIYDDELMGILVSVLESKGFTLIEDGSLYEIVRSTDAAQSNAKVVSPESSASGNLMVTQAIVVKGENVDIVAAKIRYLISKTAKLMTMKESNTMLITDYPKNIETVKQVINDIDTNNAMIVKIFPVKNTEGKKLQAKLADIAKSIFNEKVDSELVKIIHDENANSIIVVGNAKNVKKVEELVTRLDVESNIASSLQIFTLKNSDAKAVATTINEIISKQTFADPAMKPNISASEEINAVIVVGDPQVIKGIKVIVDELDKEKYQVYVQARIINIYKKDAIDLGVKYGFDGAAVSSSGGLYTLATNMTGKSVAVDATQFLTIPTNLSHGFALGAAIDFLEKNDASKSISNPSILCVNNKESSIYVGQTISIATGSISSATTSISPGLTSSYKREDVGLTLKIKPRVSSEEKVTLEVEAILESLDSKGDVLTGEQPITSKQEVKTQAILRHGENIIIGGLVKNTDINNVSKLPFLGDIPLIGEYLFSSTSKTEEETNLVVILTPYIIDNSEALSKLQEELGIAAILQQKYNTEVFANLEKKKDAIEDGSDQSKVNPMEAIDNVNP
ncbi:MAG: secretin N-terminal domain-containing protein [Sulfurimonas sp.]|nr:secretin N-terminal domain-containing protein [Sulfurimonas sp.]